MIKTKNFHIIISILIIKLGLETVLTSLMILLDANLDIDLQSKIIEKINTIYGVKGVGPLKIRRSGPFKMVECIIKYTIDILFAVKIGEISFHIIKNNFVDIYKADKNDIVNEIIKRYRQKKLVPITAPTHSIEKSQVTTLKN